MPLAKNCVLQMQHIFKAMKDTTGRLFFALDLVRLFVDPTFIIFWQMQLQGMDGKRGTLGPTSCVIPHPIGN